MFYSPELDDVSTFVLVAKTGSFTKAAKNLGLSTNAVSRRVIALEASLGVRLLYRTTRSLSLTQEGFEFYGLAEKSISDLMAARELLRSKKDVVRGLVRVAMPSVLANRNLLLAFEKELRRYTDLQIRTMISDDDMGRLRESVDISIEPGPVGSTDRVARFLGRIEWKLAASPSYVNQFGIPKKVEDLEDHFCLPFVGKTKQKSWSLKTLHGEIRRVRIKSHFASNDSRTLRHAVYAGLGIGPLPPVELEESARSGLLLPILPAMCFAEASEVFAVFHRGADKFPRNRVVLDVIAKVGRVEFGSEAIAEL